MSKPNVVAIVQARMGSTRLPGKVLTDVGGMSMLARVVRRVSRAALVDRVVVAMTQLVEDDAIEAECGSLAWYRGSPIDVLDRYYVTAEFYHADVVVRITADCPFIDPDVIDHVVMQFMERDVDYAANTIERTYPRGLDIEVFSFKTLYAAMRNASESYQREHVTPYVYQNPDLFRLHSVKREVDRSSHRWTVDTPEDLSFARALYERLGNRDDFSWTDALAIVEAEPELAEINAGVRQKTLEGEK